MNIFSFIQTLNIFDVITPVIGLLPERIVQQITKYVDIKRMFGKEDMIEKVYKIASRERERSKEAGDEFIITGHSLGGAITAILSSKLNVPGIAFSPPGTKSVLKRFGIDDQSQTLKNLTTVIMDRDLVSMVDEHIGSVNQLSCSYNETKLCHDPHAILCEIYSSCGDHRKRSLTYGCNEEEIRSAIQEYRKLLNNQQLLLVVEKPLTKILPELFEENNDMPSIYSNLLTDKQNKNNLRLHRKLPKSSKKNILTSHFNLS